jgi:hypothetical protein
LYESVSGTTSTYAAGGPGTYAITNQANTATTGTPTTGTSYTINSTNAVLTTATAITGYATSGAVYNAGGLTTTGTYYILTIPTSGAGGTITVGTSYGANPASWTSTTAGLSWTTVAGSVFGNLSSGTTYYISSINSNQVTLSTSATLTPTVTLTTQGGTWNSVAGATNIAATSEDGLYWTSRTLSTSGSWPIAVFGNPNNNPVWVALTSGTTVANSIATGATTQARAKIVSGTITEIRMIEPGSGYATAPTPSLLDPNVSLTPFTNSVTPTAVANANGTITVPSGNYAVGQAVIVSGTNTGTAGASFITGYTTGTTYYVMTGGTAVTSIRLTDTYANAVAGTGNLTATVGTLVGITFTINFVVRTATGVMANPSFTNRGLLYATATGSVATGNGFADIYQSSAYVNISNIYTVPTAGSNITLSNGDGTYYKLVVVNNLVYSSGSNLPYTATFQVSPPFTSLTAPAHGTTLTMRIKYSQVRLTGHDFLNIGTGNQTSTNYPGTPAIAPDSTKQTAQFGGGRTFFTSTDQDGNFNVGNLFTVVQSTGVATLNANAFNLAGLNSLSLGSVALGTGSAIITSFSTDPYFTANSDNVVPTQKATKSYISSQIGGGGSSLNVNTLTAGIVYIFNNQISTTNGNQINVSNKLYFVGAGGIDGVPLAMNFLLS